MKVILKIYDGDKYKLDSKVWGERRYDDVEDFEVKTISRHEILKETSEDGLDEHSEYLILKFNNGETATYGNSHVDLFILH